MKENFDGNNFIKDLAKSLATGFGRTIRVIITSREGYFYSISKTNNIEVQTMLWNQSSVNNWCKYYVKVHNEKKDWCERFKEKYNNLNDYDKRKDIFCTPIILHICCVNEIDISKHNSVASIYDEAFNLIGKRMHSDLREDNENSFKISKQFTKELAFQMFLNDKLEDVLGSDLVIIAKQKVYKWIRMKKIAHTGDLEFNKLFAINHFAYSKYDAVEFAHKTVGEYFTALKLYEDYFEHMFDVESDKQAENMWRNIFNAFRYKPIPLDIMDYLVELIRGNIESYKTWEELFYDSYYVGIEKQLLFTNVELYSEYKTSNIVLIEQMFLTFRNLSWLLTGMGFNNDKFIATPENLEILASYTYGDVNFKSWKNLNYINLSFHNLEKANLEGAHLSNAYLINTYLTSANLVDARLIGANLEKANLTGAKLMGANFKGVTLDRAYLIGASIENADINGKFKNVCLLESDLPQYDKYIQEGNIKFIRPTIMCNGEKNIILKQIVWILPNNS